MQSMADLLSVVIKIAVGFGPLLAVVLYWERREVAARKAAIAEGRPWPRLELREKIVRVLIGLAALGFGAFLTYLLSQADFSIT